MCNDRHLRRSGYRQAGSEVTSASDGQEGLSLFSSGTFDLVITDVKMPGISGIEVLRRIRSLDPKVPLLVVTAFGDMEMAVEAMREGACYFLAKPFDREHLLLAVEEILGRRCLAEAAEDLRVPSERVERGIVCVFPQGGGSVGFGPQMRTAGRGRRSTRVRETEITRPAGRARVNSLRIVKNILRGVRGGIRNGTPGSIPILRNLW